MSSFFIGPPFIIYKFISYKYVLLKNEYYKLQPDLI